MGVDPTGELVWWAAAALGGAAWEVASYLIGNAISGQKSTWTGTAKAALKGAIIGVAFGAAGKGIQTVGKVAKAISKSKVTSSATEIIGKAHGSVEHQARINATANSLAESGNYSKIFLNKALKTAGLSGSQRPDIIAMGKNGIYETWEFASKSQACGTSNYRELVNKMITMKVNNPTVIFHDIIPW